MEWKNFFRGLAIGASDIIPGVSGGTIALILGIYPRLIEAISLFFTHQWKRQLAFLLPLVVGFGIAIFSLSNLLEWLLATYPEPTFFFFTGLIAGTIPFLLKEADYKQQFQFHHYGLAIFAAVAIILTGIIRGEETSAVLTNLAVNDYIFLFIAGILASVAMILPGISGSFILVLLGFYETIIRAISTLHFPIIMTVAIGVVVGIVSMSKLLHRLLKTHRNAIYALMSGLLFGSLFVIFPGIPENLILLVMSILTFITGLSIAIILGKVE